MLNCSKCKDQKSVEFFKKDNRKSTGRSSWCRECDNYWHRERRKRRSPEELERDRLKNRQYSREYIYGITPSDYVKMWEAQNGICAICKLAETRIIKGTLSSLSIDHNHTTGQIRGLLCDSCNKIIGLLKESPELCLAMSNYIAYWNKQ